MKPTLKEIEDATDELRKAMVMFMDLDMEETDIKLKKIKARKRLSMARDEVRALQFN